MKKEIDVHDDKVMREMGFDRPFVQSPRDESVWSKTPNERRLLKRLKHSVKKTDMHFHLSPRKRPTTYGKLIINLRHNNVFSKSTYSYKCFNTHIDDILDRFRDSKGESVVVKYSYNA